jgi:hypothetical protein
MALGDLCDAANDDGLQTCGTDFVRIAKPVHGNLREIARFGLAVAERPIRSPSSFATVQVIWHMRLGEHPANRWLRQALSEAA